MFKPATREKTKARVLLAGPSGSGKTRAALEIASGLGDRIAVIDTENRSASLYVGLNGLKFDVCELSPPYTYDKYLAAMRACFDARSYDVLVIDSLTHVWSGEGGALELVDAKTRNGGNKFTAFADVTPQHNRLLSVITASPVHILCTVRTKTAYVLEEKENRYGKMVQTPRKVGLAPIFRDGVEYEFSVQLDINLAHEVTVAKTRITELDGVVFAPDALATIGTTMRAFHETGTLPKSAPVPALRAARLEPARAPQREEPSGDEPFVARLNGALDTKPLPLRTSKNYPVKEFSDCPFVDLPDAALSAYLENYTAKLNEPTLQANHRAMCKLHVQAAEAEMERRLAEEGQPLAADSTPEAGEVVDTDWDPETGEVLDHPPADDLEEKLRASVEMTRAGVEWGNTNESLGLVGADAPANQSKRTTRKGAA